MHNNLHRNILNIILLLFLSIQVSSLFSNQGPTLLQKKTQKTEKLREEELVVKDIKIDELMISKDDAPNVLKFKKYYLITPNTVFSRNINMFRKSKSKEIGKKVNLNFEYNSGTNSKFLKVNEIRKFNLDEI